MSSKVTTTLGARAIVRYWARPYTTPSALAYSIPIPRLKPNVTRVPGGAYCLKKNACTNSWSANDAADTATSRTHHHTVKP